MRLFLAGLIFFGVFVCGTAWADVIVLENRSDEKVELRLGKERNVKLELAPLEVKAFRTNGTVRCEYTTKQGPQQYRLEPNQLYAYQRDALGRQLLQEVSFPEPDADPQPIPKSAPIEQPNGKATVRVKLFVDDENPRRAASAQTELRRRLRAASDQIAKACGISFEMAEAGRWESDDSLTTPELLLADFRDQVAVAPGELAIGFTSQLAAPRGTPYQTDVPPPLTSHLLIRDWNRQTTESERITILTQQLAAWLGAELTPEQTSVMRTLTGNEPPRGRELSLRIDGANVLAMNLVAEQLQNLRVKSFDDLDAATRQRLRRIRFGLDQARNLLTNGSRRSNRRQTGEIEDRYAVMFADGTTMAGARIEDWRTRFMHARIGKIPIFRSSVPVRWIRLNGVQRTAAAKSYVEIVGGDRLPGRVVEFVADDSAGVQKIEQLRVEPTTSTRLPDSAREDTVDVVLSHVRRIVLADRQRVFQGNTAWLKDGRTLKYESIRFVPNGVELLVAGKIERVAWDALTELQLAPRREWPMYVRALAQLNSQLRSPMMTAESVAGTRVTGNVAATEARVVNDRVFHGVQPAWTAEPIWLPQEETRIYTFFEPTELPLTRLEPAKVRQRGFVARPVPWRRDANVAGGALNSGGYEFAWGLGTQSYTELHFPLPPPAVGFRGWLGLDRSVSGGGCAIGKVVVGPTDRQLLFQSAMLIGSSEIQDTGLLRFPQLDNDAETREQQLVLITDPANVGRPANADPFEIRDLLNWLEPMLLLDRSKLKAAVDRAR